ncbi:asparaginase [Coprothermobacteraceae bacterium]|nr:asparaginase [Coprothermobacteraceae bacterium]
MNEYENMPTLGAVVTRGNLVESVHYVDVAVVDATGRLIASAGSPQRVTYLRSASKPLQVLPLVLDNLHEAYGFSAEEIALMCASHSGTLEHVALVRSALSKIGLDEGYLRCGVHEPYDKSTADFLKSNKLEITPAFHNCSGKHAAMLAQCVAHNWTLENYYRPEHPVQQRILSTMSFFTDVPKDRIILGIDGCGVPVFGMPLYNAALGFARFSKPDNLPPELSTAVRYVTHAMTSHPFLVAGPDRFDTDFMSVLGRRFVSKIGAEAVQAVGVLDKGIGIVVKVSDGNSRALAAITLEVLRQLGLINDEELRCERLSGHYMPPVKNHRGEVVGNIKPVITLKVDPGWLDQ